MVAVLVVVVVVVVVVRVVADIIVSTAECLSFGLAQISGKDYSLFSPASLLAFHVDSKYPALPFAVAFSLPEPIVKLFLFLPNKDQNHLRQCIPKRNK